MAADDLRRIAEALGNGELDERAARRRIAQLRLANDDRQPAALIADALAAYDAGEKRRAQAQATVVELVARAWLGSSLQFWRRRPHASYAFDLAARALAARSLIALDEGHEAEAADLRLRSQAMLAGLSNPAPARFAIDCLTAQREMRTGNAGGALARLDAVLALPGLDDEQRAAANALRAEALLRAGDRAGADAALSASSESFQRAGRSAAALEAELERGVQLFAAGDASSRGLLTRVAASAAATDAPAVEVAARLHLGVLAANAKDHQEAAREFEAAAAAARRAGDDSSVVIGLRNAADEHRRQGRLEAAEGALLAALSVESQGSIGLEQAKARLVLAAVRQDQGRDAEAATALDEAQRQFGEALDRLQPDASEAAREHLQSQLDKVAAMRRRVAR